MRGPSRGACMSLFAKKDLETVVREANDPNLAEGGHGLKRSLGAFHLTMLGIGAIIGAGIFSLTGAAAANYAGPGIAYSFVIGGILCAFAGLCYAELASMIPVAGSAYAYAYTTMGELVAWIIGWDLVLEYAFGAVVVSIAWSGYLVQFFSSLDHLWPGGIFHLSDSVLMFTKGPFETVTLANGHEVAGYWNVPATIVSIGCASVLYRGITESAWVNNLIVVLKVTIVCVFILLGIGLVSGENLFVNEHATGLMALVPERALVDGNWRYGWGTGGVLTGAGVVFFAYIGFDAVSTTAQEARNPKRDLPIGILTSLAICTILYILVAITLTGVVRYEELGVPAPIAVGINRIVELRGWEPGAANTFTACIKLGALAGLTSVILVMMLGQTRVFYAMSKDGLLPWFENTHPKYKTPHMATVVTGVFVALAGGSMPMHLVGELVSIGTLLAFVLVCLGVPILRRSNPKQPRPFTVPAPWVVGILGALACLWVMIGLPVDTWGRLVVWLEIGLVLYAMHGRFFSLVSGDPSKAPRVSSAMGGLLVVGALVAFVAAYYVLLVTLPFAETSFAGLDSIPWVGGFLDAVLVLIIGFAVPGAVVAAGVGALVVGTRSISGPKASATA
jgi:APA family basic amino acid/polyamine antiporter